MEQIAVSAFSGVVAAAVTHPLNTLGVHKQTGRKIQCRPSLLYRGLGPACLQASLVYSIFLGSYDCAHGQLGCSVTVAAVASAVAESAVNGPLETLKNLRQTGQKLPLLVSARASILLKGSLGLLCREIPGNEVYFCSYEWTRFKGLNALLGGVVAGACFTAVTFPLDSMRVQLVTGRPVWPTFRGFGPLLLEATVETAVLFSVYEMLTTTFNIKTAIGHVE